VYDPSSNNEWFATISGGHGGSGFGTETYQFTIAHDRGTPRDGIQKELIICSIEQDPEIFYCGH
jgi:hypothetical protein